RRPAPSPVRRLEQHVRGEIKRVRLERRKNNGKRAVVAVFTSADGFGRNVRNFAKRLIRPRHAPAIKNVRVQRIDSHVAILLHAERMPFAEADLPVVAPAQRPGRAAFLLRAVDPVGKTIVRRDVIELRRRLVVPGTPGRSTIYANDGALIARQCDDFGIARVYPDALVIVAPRRALEADESFAAV